MQVSVTWALTALSDERRNLAKLNDLTAKDMNKAEVPARSSKQLLWLQAGVLPAQIMSSQHKHLSSLLLQRAS